MKKILLIFGTRPEAIKLAPVYLELKKHPDEFDVRVCVTGQHRQMLDQVLELFEIRPDFDLNIMKERQDLFDITSAVLLGLRSILREFKPNTLVVHGDTTTTMAASIAGFYEKIPVAHVEAGLRTGDLNAPWPEEFNRRVASIVTSLHFAPTERAKENLLKEGIAEESIFVTGNTVIDALFSTIEKIDSDKKIKKNLQEKFPFFGRGRKNILLTGHRRENFGEGFENIFGAIRDIINSEQSVDVIYPIHLNPSVREPALRILCNEIQSKRVFLVEPQDYLSFVYLMKHVDLIITDSGGVQEEAPSVGVPVLVTRHVTERPEALTSGLVFLVGSIRGQIYEQASQVLDNVRMRSYGFKNPYGDGTAATQIVQILKYRLA